MSRAAFDETSQRVHDYTHLVKRWRRVARAAGLTLETFATVGEYPVCSLRTRGSLAGGLYISAGIHGDEPAATEALVQWAETHLRASARKLPLFILPCLNPWGLTNNRRSDERGRDLNRLFHRRISPLAELKKLIAGETFALGLALHEDYDARGVYLYEIASSLPNIGRRLLDACVTRALPVDPRRRIEEFPFKQGLLARRIDLNEVPICPEALHLFPKHAPRFLTFETPSEFSLADRVQAQQRMIEACVGHLSRASG